MRMKPEIKELWLEALKEYPQTHGKLRDENGFCCLGVLCDVYHKVTGLGEWGKDQVCQPDYFFVTDNLTESAILPSGVAIWAGLDIMPQVAVSPYRFLNIATLNDGSKSSKIEPMNFAQISEYIKEQL